MWSLLKKKLLKFINKILQIYGWQISKYLKPSFIKIIEENKINVILDVGANSGQFAKILRKNGYKNKIISFEPTKQAYKELLNNSSNDNLWIVHPRVAIGDEIKNIKINVASNNGESSSILQMGKIHRESAPYSKFIDEEIVKQITIDSIFEKNIKIEDNVMLKIDVQGYEDHVLGGIKNNINKIKTIKLELSLVSLYEGDKLYNHYISKLQSLGFEIWDLEPGHRNSLTGKLLQFDGVFVRKV